MLSHYTRPRDANVVAIFDDQNGADEAVLELRLARFRDHQIGYFSRSSSGELTDLLERNFWIVGSTLGALAGAALGIAIAHVLPAWENSYARAIDPLGLAITCATFGVLFASFIGGMIGGSIPRSIVNVPLLGRDAGPFVLAVCTDERQDQALEILRGHGGQEVLLTDSPQPTAVTYSPIPRPI
jgi:ABC-type enterochelin transport system permease subunit